MKNNLKLAFLILALITLIAFLLPYRSESRYSREREAKREAIYDRGYADGYNDAPSYDIGFEDGFREGFVDVSAIRGEAEHYARRNSGWNPEEAIWIIDEYRAGDDEPPTKEEYEDAINSLYYFYMYFYSSMYK